jgi:hypothetical protein
MGRSPPQWRSEVIAVEIPVRRFGVTAVVEEGYVSIDGCV